MTWQQQRRTGFQWSSNEVAMEFAIWVHWRAISNHTAQKTSNLVRFLKNWENSAPRWKGRMVSMLHRRSLRMDRMQPLDNWQWASNGACHLVIVSCSWSSSFSSSALLQRIVKQPDRAYRRALVDSCYYTSWAWSRTLVTSCYHLHMSKSIAWSYGEPRVSMVYAMLPRTSWTSKALVASCDITFVNVEEHS